MRSPSFTHMHYRALVRLAALLVRDTPTAEEVVQDAFVAMHGGWQRLRDAEKALAYLRQAVVNRSRSVLRHRTVIDKNMQKAPPDMPSAEHGALVLLERHAVVAALRTLPERQREAIVLRYYADLSEAEIAASMGISRGAVKSHTVPRHDRPPRGPGAGVMTRPGHDGTPPPGHDFGEFLRHALHAAADQVEPRPDGLERIRARVKSGPAYASKHSGATAAAGGFLADMVRRWNTRRGGSPGARFASARRGAWSRAAPAARLAGRAAPAGPGDRLRRVRHRRRPGGGAAAAGLPPAQLGGGNHLPQQHRSSGRGRIGQHVELVGRRCQSEQHLQQRGQARRWPRARRVLRRPPRIRRPGWRPRACPRRAR